MNTPEQFWSNVKIGEFDECWPWKLSVDANGYGTLCWNKKSARAHRVAFVLKNGPIEPGRKVLHRCDTPICCNPFHLWEGTQQDNVADMVAKGRHRYSKKYSMESRKLDERDADNVRIIRAMGFTYQKIADLFGVRKSLIEMVCNQKGRFS